MSGYWLLRRVARTELLSYLWPTHQHFFSTLRIHLDDIFIVLLLGVILWWRLGHVIFYDLGYYLSNLMEIVQINKWWMSFVWGILGVMIWLRYIKQKYSLSRRDFLLFGDFILLAVPLWSLLWRIGNFFNQELIWKELSLLWSDNLVVILDKLNLIHIYTLRDNLPRVNINIIQSLFEWWVLLLLSWSIFIYMYIYHKSKVWLISWVYMMAYGVIRFFMEYLKDLPDQEIYWIFSVSQLLSIGLVFLWIYVLYIRRISAH